MSIPVEGREFFKYVHNELRKITSSICSTKSLGTYYDEEDIAYWKQYIDDLYNPNSSRFTHPDEAKKEEERIFQETKLRYANSVYKISEKHWVDVQNKARKERIKWVYSTFFNNIILR